MPQSCVDGLMGWAGFNHQEMLHVYVLYTNVSSTKATNQRTCRECPICRSSRRPLLLPPLLLTPTPGAETETVEVEVSSSRPLKKSRCVCVCVCCRLWGVAGWGDECI